MSNQIGIQLEEGISFAPLVLESFGEGPFGLCFAFGWSGRRAGVLP